MSGMQFTLAPFQEARSWSAVRFVDPQNGFVSPVVTQATLRELLEAVDDGYRWEGDEVVVWSAADLSPDQTPEYEDRLSPDPDGLYDLGALGWAFELV